MEDVFQISDIEVFVLFKDIKNTHLSVHPPDGKVTISAPKDMDIEKLKAYAITKLGWIKKQQKKITSQLRESQKLYITNESHYLFGNRYLLKVEEVEKEFGIELKHKKLILRCKINSTAEEKEILLYDFYRCELRKLATKFLKDYKVLLNADIKGLSIRKMKTKWGSYSLRTRKILINIELAKKPKHLIEYIIMHEIMHYFDSKHGKIFKMMMSKYMSNWELRKKELNELPI